MHKVLLISSASLSLLLAVPGIFGQTTQKSDSAKAATSNAQSTSRIMSDTAFAKNADQGGMAEIKLGQLAEERGSSPAVTDFGERMITDHGKADDSLKSTASVDKITLPSQISARDEATYNRLSKLSGTAFDRAYARDMVRDHETDVALFQREAKDGKDAYVKTFASETLPTLQSHLKQAREMLQSVSKEASNKSATKQTS